MGVFILKVKKSFLIISSIIFLILIITIAMKLIDNSSNSTLNSAVENSPQDTPIDQKIEPNVSSKELNEKKSETLYGALRTPFSNFRITPDIKNEDYPVQFTENGLIGFKDKNGNVIVEAKYEYVNGFWKGVAGLRSGVQGAYTWKKIDINGKIYDYDEVEGFEFGMSPVYKDGKYGFINTVGELVVPLNYDKLYCAYVDDARSTYARRDDKFVYLNLTDGYEETFEKYNSEKKSEYKRTVDLKDYNLVVVNDMLIVNGKTQVTGYQFPIFILEGLDFDLYNQNRKLGTYKAKLTDGNYEGEIFVSFSDYKNKDMYYAVLSDMKIINRQVTEMTNKDIFKDVINHYLNENKAENTPIAVDAAFEGDFKGNGTIGAIVEINDNYRNSGTPQPIKEEWNKDRFINSKSAFVNTILYIPDISKIMEYKIVKSNLWTHSDWDYMTESIAFIANLDGDENFEIIIANGYYEYGDYSIVELE